MVHPRLVQTSVARDGLMLLGEALAFQDLSGLRGYECFGLEYSVRSHESLGLLGI